MATPIEEPSSAFGVVDFRRFWFAALVSNTGTWMQGAAIPYAVYEISGTTGAVGVTGLFQYLPFMVMGAVGGTLADRFARRRLLLVTQVAMMGAALALWALQASGRAELWSITALAFVFGLLGGLATPVWQAFVVELVPRDLLLGAVTLNSTQFNAARAVGPFLAGVVIAVFGVQAAFLFNAVSFLAVIAVLVVIRSAGGKRPGGHAGLRGSALGGMAEAARHILATPAILACCMAIIAVAGLGSPLFNFLPVYGEEEFVVEGWQLGLLFGAGGIGSLLFAPALLKVAPKMPRARLLAGFMGLYGLAVAAVGLSPGYWVAVVALMVFGGAYLGIASTINTTIQLVVHDHLRGKVIAIYLMCLTGALPLGLLVWGLVADVVGLRATTVAAGLLLVVTTAVLRATGRFTVMAAADDARDEAAEARGVAS
ncbi:MAG: MFS transporter [Actinomycetia bacterium]|nr:MFS transporter [Actinomycetes bacterium]